MFHDQLAIEEQCLCVDGIVSKTAFRRSEIRYQGLIWLIMGLPFSCPLGLWTAGGVMDPLLKYPGQTRSQLVYRRQAEKPLQPRPAFQAVYPFSAIESPLFFASTESIGKSDLESLRSRTSRWGNGKDIPASLMASYTAEANSVRIRNLFANSSIQALTSKLIELSPKPTKTT